MLIEDEIKEAAEVIREKIRRHNFVRIISHYDADGLSSAGILCNALIRMGVPFHTSIVPKLSARLLQDLNEGVIFFCDMGTAQIDMILNMLRGRDVVIIDHHEPPVSGDVSTISYGDTDASSVAYSTILPARTVSIFDMSASEQSTKESVAMISAEDARKRPALIHINPVLALSEEEEDTSCAASLTYLVARYLTSDGTIGNIDLAGLAVIGALGDCQEMSVGINKQILDEALKAGVISTRKGLKLGEGKLRDVLLYATDPYTELAGSPERTEAFIQRLGLDAEKEMSELSEEEHQKIASELLSLYISTINEISPPYHSHADAAIKMYEKALFGTIYLLNEEIVRNCYDFMRLIDTCGRFGKGGIGIALCLRDESMLSEARKYLRKFQVKLITELRRARDDMQEMSNIYHFYVRERGITGTLAGILARYMFINKPVIVLNRMGKPNDETKVSARCGKHLKGIVDLAKAIEVASKKVGGFGGGHPNAAGASIPAGTEEEFLSLINQIIGEQRKHLHV